MLTRPTSLPTIKMAKPVGCGESANRIERVRRTNDAVPFGHHILQTASASGIPQQVFDLVQLFGFLGGLFFETALARAQFVDFLFQLFDIVAHRG